MNTMTRSELSYSTRKFIRLEKAKIRARVFDAAKQESMIQELYQKIGYKKPAEAPASAPAPKGAPAKQEVVATKTKAVVKSQTKTKKAKSVKKA